MSGVKMGQGCIFCGKFPLGAYAGQKITAKQLKVTFTLNQFAVMHCENLRYNSNHCIN